MLRDFQRVLAILLLFWLTLPPCFAGPGPFRIVLDPGHGGSDEGTIFGTSRTRITEKEMTLKLALQAAKQLRARGFFVALTRKSDREISLPKRTAFANRWGADAFISIHMNSTGRLASSQAEGVETFILNNATDASSRRLAHLENSIVSPSNSNLPTKSDVALILKDLRLDGNLSESKRLACQIQNKLVRATSPLKKALHRRNRGVKQALFHVLLGADMPSILVEAGFLSNAKDRSFLSSPRGQSIIGRAIAEAVDHFCQQKRNLKTSLSLSKCKVN